MRTVWTIAMKDFKSNFYSPIAYIVMGGFMFIMGWMFYQNVYHFNMQQAQMNFGGKTTITEGIIRPLYGNMNVILLFLLPFVTMRIFAEERKNHTIELLMTAPNRTWEIVLGKFMAAMAFVKVMISISLIYPIILFIVAKPDWGPIVTSVLGTVVLAGCYLSLGILFSAMTENQIVAGALTFAALLFFWLISWGAQSMPDLADVLNHLSLISHFGNLSQGVVASVDVVYFFTFIGFMLFLTRQVLESYRWRQ